MKRFLALALVLPILAACSPQQQQQVAGMISTGVDAVAAARQACTSLGPLFQVAGLVSDTRVQSIVGYANSVCGPLSIGAVPATIDGNTATWLGSLAGMIRVLVPA